MSLRGGTSLSPGLPRPVLAHCARNTGRIRNRTIRPDRAHRSSIVPSRASCSLGETIGKKAERAICPRARNLINRPLPCRELRRGDPRLELEDPVERGLRAEADLEADRQDLVVAGLRIEQPLLGLLDTVGIDHVVEAQAHPLVDDLRHVSRRHPDPRREGGERQVIVRVQAIDLHQRPDEVCALVRPSRRERRLPVLPDRRAVRLLDEERRLRERHVPGAVDGHRHEPDEKQVAPGHDRPADAEELEADHENEDRHLGEERPGEPACPAEAGRVDVRGDSRAPRSECRSRRIATR
jgi:hypothetical protein